MKDTREGQSPSRDKAAEFQSMGTVPRFEVQRPVACVVKGMRQPRFLQEGARYHVTARINRKEMLLDPAATKELFMSTVARARRKYSFRIWNFCIMNNHVHLLIEPSRGESLSAIMRWILGVFAMAWNRRHDMTGHVWGDRFHSRVLPGLWEFRMAFGYIDNNPVKASLARSAADWLYGGLACARTSRGPLIEKAPAWLRLLFPLHAPLSLPPPSGLPLQT